MKFLNIRNVLLLWSEVNTILMSVDPDRREVLIQKTENPAKDSNLLL